jgi:hypothetical protein
MRVKPRRTKARALRCPAKEHDMASRKKKDGAADGRADEDLDKSKRKSAPLGAQKGRQSEFAVSRGGMNQESRQHNKPGPDTKS